MITQEDNLNIRVRFAPSPTGFLHVGGLRTMLYSYLFAKKNHGIMVLRIEDTDQTRLVESAVEKLIDVLKTVDIEYDEGPIDDNKEKGLYGPYIQSKRLDLYKKHSNELIVNKKAYRCFCTVEDLDKMRQEQKRNKQAPRYNQKCRNLTDEEIQKKIQDGATYVVRMVIPKDETIIIDDMIRGRVVFESNLLDDHIIMKSDGYPTYHLAVVVDDHYMKISHVVRAEEWLPSTPKHYILYKSFGWEIPKYAHLPLLVNKDKAKLSKRHGDVSVEDFLRKGYLPEALINFIAFLGWHPGKGETQEIFTRQELISRFNLEDVHKSAAVFDVDKLDWMNGQYIKKMSLDDLYKKAESFYRDRDFVKSAKPEMQSDDYLKKVLEIEKERLQKLDECGCENKFFFTEIDLPKKDILRWKQETDNELKENLLQAKMVLENLSEEEWHRTRLEEVLMIAAGLDRGGFLWPLRTALTNEKRSPSPFDCAWILGKNETLRRIQNSLDIF